MPPLAAQLKKNPIKKHKVPVWDGPCAEGANGGVTQSLISRWLSCRERFRLLVVEGLKPADRFEPKMEFGNMWHICEEALSANEVWGKKLLDYCEKLSGRYQTARQDVQHWYSICSTLFPIYVEYWSQHHDSVKKTPLLQEQPFDVKYKLPSGRVVRLRGKWDAVDYLLKHQEGGRTHQAGLWVQENKTKSTIDFSKIGRQVTFDLQTLLYRIALDYSIKNGDVYETMRDNKLLGCSTVIGTRYNVIRRSAHKGGKGKTAVESMMEKLNSDRKANRMGEWFARWKIEITPKDVEKFKVQCLNPVLEQLCDWWEMLTTKGDPFSPSNNKRHSLHYRLPYGIYNPVTEGGFGDVDSYFGSGSEVGLRYDSELFPELKEG